MSKNPNTESEERRRRAKNEEPGMAASRSPSTDSTASVSTGTTGRFTGQQTETTQEMITTYGQNLYDTVCCIVWCPKHKKTALCKINDKKGFFFPMAAVRTGIGRFDTIRNRVKEVLRVEAPKGIKPYLSYSTPKFIHILYLQIPNYLNFVSRVIFLSELTFDPKNATNCCSDTSTLFWVSSEDLINRRVNQLWGPEVELLIEALVNNRLQSMTSWCEIVITDVLKFSPKDRPKFAQEEMVKSAGFTETDVIKMFGDFIQHSFPSQYWNLFSFEDYLNKTGVPELIPGYKLNTKALFRAFNLGRPFIGFDELLLGMSALDKNTSHGDKSGPLRCSYIFRYYNESEDKTCLNIEDIKGLARDILRIKSNGQFDETKVDSEAKQIISAIVGNDPKKSIDETVFVKSIGERRLKGTSSLFRSVVSPLQQIRLKRLYLSIQMTNESSNNIEGKLQSVVGTCRRCRQKNYSLAVHTVKLSKEGLIVDPTENRGQTDFNKKSRTLRRQSEKSFSSTSTANYLLEVLRSFAYSGSVPGINADKTRSNPKLTDVWSNKNNRIQIAEKILNICEQSGRIFKSDSRVIKVTSPIYVLGDIHGNFKDLMRYENSLWKMGPTCLTNSFLFLGDIVDRGDYSIECILYLLANKLVSPDKYYILRGNHELRPVQMTYTFRNECVEKFGNKTGPILWDAFNNIFDVMPIAAVIDESIFCAHGGIPTHCTKIEELQRIPTPLPEPETQSQTAWEVLWNDPITNTEYRDCMELMRQQQSRIEVPGFLPNTKRGTAYFFAEQALNRFLAANRLSHVIRAHECIPNGFAFHMGGKCITVFSSSKYCNGINEAAVVMVTDDKIRVIKIDTN